MYLELIPKQLRDSRMQLWNIPEQRELFNSRSAEFNGNKSFLLSSTPNRGRMVSFFKHYKRKENHRSPRHCSMKLVYSLYLCMYC